MQRVIHQYKNASRIFNHIEGLYSYISDDDFEFDDILWLDESFQELCDTLQSKLLKFRTPVIKKLNLPKIEYRVKNPEIKEVTVLLSGGKDSAAVAYYYLKKGYKVHLYHAHGVNKAYGDEQKAAQSIADYLKCDLHIDKIQLAGTQHFIEHPLKNYIIANGALHYAIANGYAPVLAVGNFNQSFLDMNEFEVCGGDCVEMWDMYKSIVRRVLPTFDLEIPLSTNADTFNLLANDWELFSLAVSCMSPFRFRESWRHRSEEKYNVRIFKNRCGCCWKCCVESLWLMDNGYTEYDEPFYLHGLGILAKTIYKETDEFIEDIRFVWENYMFYPIEQSKAYDKIKDMKFKSCGRESAADLVPAVKN